MSGWDAAIRSWLAKALPMAVAGGLAAIAVGLSPSTGIAACGAPFPTPQAEANAIHVSNELAFEGTVRQHWFAIYLVEVRRTWNRQAPSRFLAVGPCAGEECGVRNLIVGRSYLFWGDDYAWPQYRVGCGDPHDSDPTVIALLGPSSDAPGTGPSDVVVLAGFVIWSSYGLIIPAVIAVVIGGLIWLNRKPAPD